jgi:5'-nucleotidase
MNDNIALFDLDGTLCDYDSALIKDLNLIRSPKEEELTSLPHIHIPPYIQKRIDMICDNEDWWLTLQPLPLGIWLLESARLMGYRIMILTQGPKRNPYAWSGKKKWIDLHLGNHVDVTITRDKSLVYGKVLVDDYPGYIERWLKWRKNGLVLMPANDLNLKFEHPQVIRCRDTEESRLDARRALQTRLEPL